jgi:chorismate-pyruvate lyase
MERAAVMQLARLTVSWAVLAGIVALATAGLASEQPKQTQENIWQDEPAQPRQGWGRWGMSEEGINKVMEGLRKRDPAKAKELDRLREKDPEKFRTELRDSARPEMEQLARDYWEERRQKRNADFVEWLKTNYPDEEQSLARLKDGDPAAYAKHFDHLMNQYGYIFDAFNSNPELGAVLKEDYALKRRNDELCKQLHRERSEARRQELGAELEKVVARRYDLIVRRKEIFYEQLLKRLDDLHKQVRASKDEIAKYKDERVKQENVRQRVRALTEDKGKFNWD